MKRTSRKVVVLDSWAMIAYLDGEPVAQRVRQVLRRARRQQIVALFSLISYGECLYIVEREHGLQQAQRAAGIIDQLPLRVMPVDRSLVFGAAHVKAHHAVSYADAFVVALARQHTASVMTGDPEFDTVASEIKIDWLSDRRRLTTRGAARSAGPHRRKRVTRTGR